ncbi:MAG: ribosome silencing factor [Firmicutes bacterium]|nr:ribosome silencing factor [Bacillota bacterium]
MESKDMALQCAKILIDKLAKDLSVIYVREVTSLADYFVIATGGSSTHVKALADEVEFKLKQDGIAPDHIEGHGSNSWIVMDYNNVVVHVFSEEAREFYDLERLWKDGEKLELNFD